MTLLRSYAHTVLFWYLFACIDRVFFVASFWSKYTLSIIDLLQTFIHGLRTDMAFVGYMSIIYIIVYCITPIVYVKKIHKIVTSVIVVLLSIFLVVNIELYTNWSAKINKEALSMLAHIHELAASSSHIRVLPVVCKCLIVIGVEGVLYCLLFLRNKKTIHKLNVDWRTKIKGSIVALLLLSTSVLAIRGGWQLTPLNPSFAYFSTVSIYNHTAVNTVWNAVFSFFDKELDNYPYEFLPLQETKDISAPFLRLNTPSNSFSDRKSVV